MKLSHKFFDPPMGQGYSQKHGLYHHRHAQICATAATGRGSARAGEGIFRSAEKLAFRGPGFTTGYPIRYSSPRIASGAHRGGDPTQLLTLDADNRHCSQRTANPQSLFRLRQLPETEQSGRLPPLLTSKVGNPATGSPPCEKTRDNQRQPLPPHCQQSASRRHSVALPYQATS